MLWKLSIIFRVLIVLIPQYGYIHPDEFFQGPEIAAGDLLQYDVYRTWEFNSANPIRSIVSIHIGSVSFILFKWISSLFFDVIINPYWFLIAAPRFTMTLLSFIQDCFLYRIDKKFGNDPKITSLIFSTSFVALTFHSRTFSNNLEAICFTSLLYYVLYSLDFFESKPIHENYRQKNYISQIGFIITAGIFIRPTFILFAFFPILVWLFKLSRDLKSKANLLIALLIRISLFSLIFIILDTIYYRGVDLIDLYEAKNDITSLNFVVTPFNFIKYNLNSHNLEQHGLHPFYLHILINLPLMFGILGVMALFHLVKTSWNIRNTNQTQVFKLLIWCFPVFGLSLFPHQEPRFLIPLLAPLVLIYGQKIYNSKFIRTAWIVSNVLCVCFYSFLHQAGLVPCLLDFSKTVKESEQSFEIIFYRTYMPPRFLLQLTPSNQTKKVLVNDIRGASLDVLIKHVRNSIKNEEKRNVYIVMPTIVSSNLNFKTILKETGLSSDNVQSYFPHLTTEDLPNMKQIWKCALAKCDLWNVLKQQLSLGVYKIV